MPPASQVSCHFFSISAGLYFVRVIMAASSPFWGIHLKKSCLLIHQKKNPSFHYRDEGLASRYHPHWQRSASSADTQQKDGGPEGTRTPDLLNAIETRSQLRQAHKGHCFACCASASVPPSGCPLISLLSEATRRGYSVHQRCSQASSVRWCEPRTNRLTL